MDILYLIYATCDGGQKPQAGLGGKGGKGGIGG